MPKPNTNHAKIKSAIDKLEVDETINKISLIKSIWSVYDFFISRSFDATFVAVKKEIANDCIRLQQPIKKFKTRSGKIIRVE